ncbi:MAG: DNA adenine methylase [Rectinemataceae bacterium]|jgi:adenine-specific DNA-methyltransferase
MSPEVPDYACTRLIAYIGNKRALLPFILPVFLELEAEAPISRFLDPFAGSGAVSRLARSLGWAVMANDAEEYSRTVNEAWLGVSAEELPSLFAAEGGLDAVLASLNAMHPESGDASPLFAVEPYISRHYSPANTASPDWRRERLFYTRENGLFLDRARCAIDYLRSPREGGMTNVGGSRAHDAERAILLGLLVYEAATHANTSGVFKAYHKGFGGHGRDALGRILSPMKLERPILWSGPPAEVGREDAATFCAGRPADLCYLDPPYNQHQYGSNYHLLNTIARWDRPPVSEERAGDGSLLSAAGIPPAWKESRSAFCSARTAGEAFRDLLAAVDSRSILLSYNTEGILPAEELFEILSDRAEVSLRSQGYVKYRGGRQSASSRARNREILFLARRRESPGRREPGRLLAGLELAELRADLRLARALGGPFDPTAFRGLCDGGETLTFSSGAVSIELPSYKCLLLEEGSVDAASKLEREGKEALAELLEPVLLPDNAAACSAAARLIEAGSFDRKLQDLALGWLRKLAHRGYEDKFRALSSRLDAVAGRNRGRLSRLADRLAEVEALFERRMAGRRRYSP